MTQEGRKSEKENKSEDSHNTLLRMILLYRPFSFLHLSVLTRKLVIRVRAEGHSLIYVGNSQQATRKG